MTVKLNIWLLLHCSGFFNGATFFNGSGKDTPGNGEIAAGVMFIIMGFFWFLGAVLCTVVLIMVSVEQSSPGLHTEGGWPWNFPYPEKVFPPQQIFLKVAVLVADTIALPLLVHNVNLTVKKSIKQ